MAVLKRNRKRKKGMIASFNDQCPPLIEWKLRAGKILVSFYFPGSLQLERFWSNRSQDQGQGQRRRRETNFNLEESQDCQVLYKVLLFASIRYICIQICHLIDWSWLALYSHGSRSLNLKCVSECFQVIRIGIAISITYNYIIYCIVQ